MKQFITPSIFLVLLTVVVFTSQAHVITVDDVLTNHFETILSYGDRLAIYFHGDHKFEVIPSFDNREHVHNCSGSWRFNKSKMTMKLSGAKGCTFIKGTYNVVHRGGLLKLIHKEKRLTFEHLEDY